MRKKTVFLLVLTLISATAWRYRVRAHFSPPPPAGPGFAFYLARGQRVPSPAMLADAAARDAVPARVSPGCQSLWMETILLDLNPYLAPPPDTAPASGVVTLRLRNAAGAREALREILERRTCGELPDSVAFAGLREATTELRVACAGPSAIACVTAATWLRLHATRYFTRHFALSDIRDVGTLVHLLFATTLAGDTSDAPDSAAIAERILELSPHLIDAARAAAQLRYVDFVWNPAHAQASDALAQAIAAAERGEAARRQPSLMVAELRLAEARAKLDDKAWRERAEAIRIAFPRSGLGSYYLAWLAYRQGDRARALKLVREAVHREPSARALATERKLAAFSWRGPDSEVFRDEAGGIGLRVTEEARRPAAFDGSLPLGFFHVRGSGFTAMAGW